VRETLEDVDLQLLTKEGTGELVLVPVYKNRTLFILKRKFLCSIFLLIHFNLDIRRIFAHFS